MRRRYTKYLYIAGILLVIGNLLGSCVVFLQVNDTTHFYVVNPISYLIPQKDTLCYKKRTENTIDIIGSDYFPRPSIFFHSTYCDKILDDRTACAIESAARLHPQTHINLLYTSPVEKKTWSELLNVMVKLPNFHMIGIHVESYADGTEFEKFWKSVVIHNKVVNYKLVAEYLKFLTLHKFGGTVLDLDVIVNKQLDELGENWVVREGESMLGTDAIAMSKSYFNRNFTAMVLRSLSQQIMNRNINVSVAMTNAFKHLCPGTDFTETYSKSCHGYDIHDGKLFHPIGHIEKQQFLQSRNYNKKAYAHRLWDVEVPEKMIPYKTLYAKIAQTFCPWVYSKINNEY